MAFGGVRGHEESPLMIVCRYNPEGHLGGQPVSLFTDWMDEKKKEIGTCCHRVTMAH